MSDVFFIIGAPCSATTAYSQILGTAWNANVYVEQTPKLRRASRELIEGRLEKPTEVLRRAREAAILGAREQGLKYGDKNPCYLPFIPYLLELWDPKFVLLTRNPKEVLRAMVSFKLSRGGVFSLCEDEPGSTTTAQENPWDYSRLRPQAGDPLRGRWQTLPFIEKAAWYWGEFNRRLLAALDEYGPGRACLVDVGASSVETVRDVFEFLGLRDFDRKQVARMLTARINSTREKTGRDYQCPSFENWTREQQKAAKRHLSDVAERLGYGL